MINKFYTTGKASPGVSRLRSNKERRALWKAGIERAARECRSLWIMMDQLPWHELDGRGLEAPVQDADACEL